MDSQALSSRQPPRLPMSHHTVPRILLYSPNMLTTHILCNLLRKPCFLPCLSHNLHNSLQVILSRFSSSLLLLRTPECLVLSIPMLVKKGENIKIIHLHDKKVIYTSRFVYKHQDSYIYINIRIYIYIKIRIYIYSKIRLYTSRFVYTTRFVYIH